MVDRVDRGIGQRVRDEGPRQWRPRVIPRRERQTPLHDADAEEENRLAEKQRREESRRRVDAREERHVIGQCGPRPVPDQEGTDPAIVRAAR